MDPPGSTQVVSHRRRIGHRPRTCAFERAKRRSNGSVLLAASPVAVCLEIPLEKIRKPGGPHHPGV